MRYLSNHEIIDTYFGIKLLPKTYFKFNVVIIYNKLNVQGPVYQNLVFLFPLQKHLSKAVTLKLLVETVKPSECAK